MMRIVTKKLDRKLLKKGQAICIKKRGFLACLIRWFQGNQFNHVGIISFAHGGWVVNDSDEHGVGDVKLEHFENDKTVTKILICEPEQFQDNEVRHKSVKIIEEEIYEHGGLKKYDFLNLLLFQAIKYGWHKMTGRTLWVGGGEKYGKKKVVCREWVQYLYNKSVGLFPEYWKLSGDHISEHEQFKSIQILLKNGYKIKHNFKTKKK